MSLLFAVSAVALAPVPANDPTLALEETFVSQVARVALAEQTVDELHCLDTPPGEGRPERVCLTKGEWQAVFDRVAYNKAAGRRAYLAGQALSTFRR